ncbi:hypothetical protein [Cellulomonas sp. IC4_254]|uniref:hypothetical protein n=1 Tax=Cellulomonas sp. IC4_254 TaxID=2714040 RepID=UPI0014203852|nr:hypothetical protein [Cellulomonas sp. IC4_254]NHT17270.1 hypothetical protein [Cellulomonas sp. IC4_254]
MPTSPTTPTRVRRLLALVPVTALVFGGAVLLDADSAEAFGYNRAVSRACGSNWVQSTGTTAAGSANTMHHSGSCQDRLVAGLHVGGIISWNTSANVRGTASKGGTNLNDSTGRHKGCPTCAITLS